MPRPPAVRFRMLALCATVLIITGISVGAQEVRRGGAANRGADPRVRDNAYGGPPPPPSISGTFKGLHANGGVIVEHDDETGVVPTDRATEIIIRGQADASFVTLGSLAEVTGTLEGRQGPIRSNYLVLLRPPTKNLAAKDRFQPAFHVSPPMPGENRPTTATIRGQVVSQNPLVIATSSEKVPIRLDESAQIWIEVLGGDPRSLCHEGDRVEIAFQPPQRRDAIVAQTITITRAEPFKAGADANAAKDAKKNAEASADKAKRAAKAKVPSKGKTAKPAAEVEP